VLTIFGTKRVLYSNTIPLLEKTVALQLTPDAQPQFVNRSTQTAERFSEKSLEEQSE
jgi:hypothetical protein